MGLFGNNNESELKSFEQTIERLKSEYATLENDNRSKDAEIERLKKIIESMGKTEEIVTPSPEVAPEETPAPIQGADYTPAFEALPTSINELKEQTTAQKALMDEFKVLLSRRDIQDENMRSMHKEMEQYKGNFFAKITQPYMLALLDLHKRFFETYSHFDHLDNNEESDFTQLYKELLVQFDSAVKAIENRIYNDFGIEYYEPKENDDFNPKAHQAFEIIETDDATLHRKVAKVIYGGFRDLDNDKIIRPARIACYKNNQQE